MAVAPYDNRDARQNPHLPMLAGQFHETEFANFFHYASRENTDGNGWLSSNEFPHLVFVGPLSETRYGKVLKTVAYIVVDEDENGNPVIEKWKIKNHRVY